jgi:hypothetical protein
MLDPKHGVYPDSRKLCHSNMVCSDTFLTHWLCHLYHIVVVCRIITPDVKGFLQRTTHLDSAVYCMLDPNHVVYPD